MLEELTKEKRLEVITALCHEMFTNGKWAPEGIALEDFFGFRVLLKKKNNSIIFDIYKDEKLVQILDVDELVGPGIITIS